MRDYWEAGSVDMLTSTREQINFQYHHKNRESDMGRDRKTLCVHRAAGVANGGAPCSKRDHISGKWRWSRGNTDINLWPAHSYVHRYIFTMVVKQLPSMHKALGLKPRNMLKILE